MSEQLNPTQQTSSAISAELNRSKSFIGRTNSNNNNGNADGFVSSAGTPLSNAGGISRERSFVRSISHHAQQQHQQSTAGNNGGKRRSLAFGHPHQHAVQQQQMRGGGAKPTLELYRPPSECRPPYNYDRFVYVLTHFQKTFSQTIAINRHWKTS